MPDSDLDIFTNRLPRPERLLPPLTSPSPDSRPNLKPRRKPKSFYRLIKLHPNPRPDPDPYPWLPY